VRAPAMITMPRWLKGLVLTGLLLCILPGYDTKEAPQAGPIRGHVSDLNKWHGIYYCHGSLRQNCRENEHAWLAQTALDRIAPGSPWGFAQDDPIIVNDLSTGFFRADIGARRQRSNWDPADVMGLPQRTLPGATNFAGIPDFSYTIYDWINMNELCPPIRSGQMPAGVPKGCHNYTYWQGGGFNASHFGSQATRSYQRLHATALALAARARQLRQRIEADPANLEAYRDVIREAEMEALAYEGYAQHFLQDRWAMGHMFERWGAPEYDPSGIGLDPTRALMAGAFTGIIHGYESVLHVPDALSSPEAGVFNTVRNLGERALDWLGRQVGLVEETTPPPAVRVEIPNWRRPGSDTEYPGVGDYRAYDMQRGRYTARANLPGNFRLEYNSETNLPVGLQYAELMRCSGAGFAEVIRAFGANGSGYGLNAVALSHDAGSLRPDCFNAWATNDAILMGMGDEFQLAGRIATAAQAGFRIGHVINLITGNGTLEDLPPEIQGFVFSRNDTLSITRIYVRAQMAAYNDPSGLDLAQGGLGRLLNVPTGDTYPIASYLEPGDLSALPDQDPRGRDSETVFGFFNRSHSDYFCGRSDELLTRLRRSADPSERATCRILAQRIYSETDDTTGLTEHSFVELNGSQQQTEPLCRLSQSSWTAPDFGGDSLETLHAGYVSWDFGQDAAQTFALTSEGLSMQSVANWCDATPVIDAVGDPDLAQAHVVAVIEDTRDTLDIRGLNFGDTPGTLRIGQSPDGADTIEVSEIVSWSDTRIRFRVEDQFSDIAFQDRPGAQSQRVSEARLFVTRAGSADTDPGIASVGNFVIRRLVEPPRVSRLTVTPSGNAPVAYAYSRPVDPPLQNVTSTSLFSTPAPQADDPVEPAFRPVEPGQELSIEIHFDTDIERDADDQILTLGGEPLDGRWLDERRWRGRFDVPEGDAFEALRGPMPFAISVQSRRGAWTDGDPSSPGPEPDRDHQLLFDHFPVILERVAVRAGAGTVYDAEWSQAIDLEDERQVTTAALGQPVRTLDVAVARAVSESGQGRLRLRFSAELEAEPTVTVGGATAQMRGSGREWQGRFDLEEAASLRDANGDLQLTVAIEGRSLDADPSSVALIRPPGDWSSGAYWDGLEAQRGGRTTSSGGPDLWHLLGEAPALSFLIILDGSGSMAEGGRMDYAREGITQSFANLPDDQVIEYAAVAFSGCSGFTTRQFTRDAETIRQFLVSVSPYDSTPLAAAHDVARGIFTRNADPRALAWRYASFTDGAETCDGNVTTAIRDLESVLARHEAPDSAPLPETEVAEAPRPAVNCQADSWSGYAVDVRDGGRHLDRITLVEHSFSERALPDGRCLNIYEVKDYGVYYGRTTTSGWRWGINSRPSETRTEVGSATQGQASLDRVRNLAGAARNGLTDLPTARRRVGEAVSAADPEQG
jgi:hypothetical protein